MKILLVGAGALGVYFCGRLAQHGNSVSAVVRSHFDYIASNGYDIKSEKGDFKIKFPCYHQAADYQDEPDLIIYCAKALPDIDGASLIRDAVKSPKTAIMLIQNGICIEQPFAEAFPENELFSSVAYIGATRNGPGEVEQKGAARLIFGNFKTPKNTPMGQAILKMFLKSQVECEYVENIQHFRWQKLLWNTPFNPISVIGGRLLTNQMIDGPIGDLARQVMQEVITVAGAEGITLNQSLIEKNIVFTRDFPPYKSSMLIDFENQRELEVDAIIGRVVKLAKSHKIAVPYCETITALLYSVDRQNRKVN